MIKYLLNALQKIQIVIKIVTIKITQVRDLHQ